jgi:hypothetical protein
MTYSVEAAREERQRERTGEPFTFELDGRTWTMKDPTDLPAAWFTWSIADYARNVTELVVEDGFPADLLTAGDLNGLVAAWLGATPGE